MDDKQLGLIFNWSLVWDTLKSITVKEYAILIAAALVIWFVTFYLPMKRNKKGGDQ